MGSTTATALRSAIAKRDVAAWLRSVKDPAERTHQLAKCSAEDLQALGPLLDSDGLVSSVSSSGAADALGRP